MKKRLLIVAPAALAIALSTGVGPASASAVENANANCVGVGASNANDPNLPGQPGLGGFFNAIFARRGVVDDLATTNCG